MLENFEQIQHLLRCPKSGESLVLGIEQLRAVESKHVYNFVGSHPVLVDFDNSVLDEKVTLGHAGASVVERDTNRGVRAALKRIVAPNSTTTHTNVAAMIHELKMLKERPRVLIIGGGTVGGGMIPFYDDADIELVAFDIYASPTVQFVADGHSIPLQDCCVDGVISQAVLEHVLEPQKVVAEIHRILQPDGLVYAETPFLQQVHEGAYDFTRYTESGHRYLFREFENISSGALHGAADQLLRSFDYLFRGLFRSRRAGKAIKLLLFWLKYLDNLIPAPFAADAASAVFFFGRKSTRQMTPVEAIQHYGGADH